MTLSRRRMLQSSACALALPRPCVPASPTILSEGYCLAEESARGFRMANLPGHVVVMAAVQYLDWPRAAWLKWQLEQGKQVIFECAPAYSARQRQVLLEAFALRVGLPKACSGEWSGEYVEYVSPAKFVRPFCAAVSISGPNIIEVAKFNGMVVAARCQNFVFVGSLLGPALCAGDGDAFSVVRALTSQGISFP